MTNPPQFVIASEAKFDIVLVLDWTRIHFGVEFEHRYEALIKQGILDVVSDPNRVGTKILDHIARDIRLYHLSHSRYRVPRNIGRMKHPRHILIFRV